MPLRILVVEDHAAFRRFVCTELQRRAEFEPIEAADGPEAVRKAEELQPDVMLLDLNLPTMHGFEVAAQIPRLAPGARLIFMSQESSPDIVRKALSLGAQGYIQKLSAATDLLPAIDAVLAGARFVSRSVELIQPDDSPVRRRHEMLFCSDDAAIVDGFTGFIATALNAAGAAIILATEPHQTDLLRALRAQGVDVDGAMARGSCLSFDADMAPDPARVFEAIDNVRAAAARAGKAHPRVAFAGERAGRLWAAGRTEEAVELEQFGNQLAQDVDILCLYPLPGTNDDQSLAVLCAAHTCVLPASHGRVRRA